MDLRAARKRGRGPRGFFEGLLDELIEAAKHQARLRKVEGDGKQRATRREHLEVLVRAGRKPASILEGPDVDPAVAYLWRWHMELERVREVTEAGLKPTSYTEIDAWARLTGKSLMPYEVDALVRLDLAARHPGEED